MPKINSTNAKKLILRFLLKSVVLSIVLILLFISIFSFVLLKLDLDLKIIKYLSIAICFTSGLLISYISIGEFKNNLLPLSVISVLPLTVFSIVNASINDSDFVIEIIKVIFIISSSFISSIIHIKRK